VTGQAALAIVRYVLPGKGGIYLTVARGARGPVEGIAARGVAVGAVKGRPSRELLVADQREPDLIVWVAIQCSLGDIRFSAEVIGMASDAGPGVAQASVEPGPGRDLALDRRVAGQAALRRHPLPRSVAQRASRFHLGVAGIPLDERGSLPDSGQWAGTKERRPAQQHPAHYAGRHNQGSDGSVYR